MSARPRLVQEGSPIVDENDNARWQNSTPSNVSGTGRSTAQASIISSAYTAPVNSKPYKLQTRLVIGGGVPVKNNVSSFAKSAYNDNLMGEEGVSDMMMMDDEEGDGAFDNSAFRNQDSSFNNIFNDPSHLLHDSHHTHQHYLHQPQNHGANDVFSTEQNHQIVQQTPTTFHHSIHVNAPANAFLTQQPNLAPNNILPANPPSQAHSMPSPITSPLIVIDGANIAYNYADSLNPSSQHDNPNYRVQPNPRGITLAIQYFLKNRCRVQAVVPISWYKLKPRPTDKSSSHGKHGEDAKMITDEVEELRNLRQQGFLVACPPGDDDDAYALFLARREEDQIKERRRESHADELDEAMNLDDDACLPTEFLGGYVLSNDFFNDAIRRDQGSRAQNQPYNSSSLSHHHHPPSSLKSWLNRHRISYSFANVGITSGFDGERELEFLPNPRHVLVEAIEIHRRGVCRNNHDL